MEEDAGGEQVTTAHGLSVNEGGRWACTGREFRVAALLKPTAGLNGPPEALGNAGVRKPRFL